MGGVDANTRLMCDSIQALIQTLVTNQQASLQQAQEQAQAQAQAQALALAQVQAQAQATAQSNAPVNPPQPVRCSNWIRDFKRYDPRPFTGSLVDPIEAQMWIAAVETTFETMECPENQKVAYATFVLQKDAEIWWRDNKTLLNPEGEPMNWERFKEAFLKEYYPKSERLKKQQEFAHLVQGRLTVEKYNREFNRLKRFAPSMVDTEEKMTEKFVLGLVPRIRCMLEAFNPKTYEKALRTAKALEKPKDEKRREEPVIIGQKCPHESGGSDRPPPAHRHRSNNRPAPRWDERRPPRRIDRNPRNQDGARGRRKGALSVEDYTVGGAWLAAERVIDVVKRGTSP
ncbi:uncharacterized protein LOC111437846 [Cucurbita moschata]|uniref:Uncharacterized protein LOC111437846 n=1 Tax=Cucurbita moschata TaxID=3662 RepID=A0A6J1EZF3_CUCMO|nr:uncharacterized protein LOC111437846 [Cucurbita moschata]